MNSEYKHCMFSPIANLCLQVPCYVHHSLSFDPISSKVRNVVVSTMTSFVATPASNGTLSSGGVDESWEPRAEEMLSHMHRVVVDLEVNQ